MTETEKKALIEKFLNGALGPKAQEQFRGQLAEDKELLDLLTLELELAKSLDPEGDYQVFIKALGNVHKDFFEEP